MLMQCTIIKDIKLGCFPPLCTVEWPVYLKKIGFWFNYFAFQDSR